jgi:DUF4097 and DUF4098 domain-containing protein YvlB
MTTTTGSTIEHRIGAEGLLAIRIRDGEVRLRATDGEVARVRDVNGHDLNDMLSVETGEGSLSLRSGRGFEFVLGPLSGRRGSRAEPVLEIELPRRASVVIEGASGTIAADGLLGDQRYRTASGEVTLRAVSGRINVEAVSGDVDITATGTADVVARTVSGDLALRAATLTSLVATSTSGDLKIAGLLSAPGPFSIDTVSGDALLAPAGDVQIEMTSVTGDLTSEFEGPSVSRGRRSLSIGRSGPAVSFRSMSGDLRVVRPVSVSATPVPAAGSNRTTTPTMPPPASPPAPAGPPSPPVPPANAAIAAAYEEARLRILRSLERGEIDVAEAGRRLETLDSGQPGTEPGGVDA